MTDQQADSSSRVTICLALLLCIPCMKAESRSWFQATVEASSQRSGRAAAAAAVPLNNLTPGTPAVADSSSSSRWGVSRFSSSLTGHIHSQEGRYGWLFPVLTSTKRGNCVVYRAKGSESLRDVARLFGLFGPRVLADNQGVVSDANQALGGRSVLLCGQHGQAAPQPVSLLAAARADAAAEQAGMPVSRKAMQTAQTGITVALKQQEQALLELKAVLDPETSVLKDWAPTLVAPESRVPVTSHCTWSYVACDARSNVIRLNMVYLNLEGKLPPGSLLAKFPQLSELYLGGNNLQGTLPADWATTTNLTHLYLNDNQLSGPLPAEWGNMRTLRVLSLPYNELTGPLPPSWGKVQSLQDLKLNSNQLSGRVPLTWAGMESLSTITLWNNAKLSGCFPAAWEAKSSNSKGLFQSPTGVLSSDVRVATMGTGITGFCTPNGSPKAAPVPSAKSPSPNAAAVNKASNRTALAAAVPRSAVAPQQQQQQQTAAALAVASGAGASTGDSSGGTKPAGTAPAGEAASPGVANGTAGVVPAGAGGSARITSERDAKPASGRRRFMLRL